VSVRLDGLVYCTGTFTYISVRVILFMDVQKLGVLDASGVLFQRVPSLESSAIFITTRYSVISWLLQ
jgi:hypothetical protein